MLVYSTTLWLKNSVAPEQVLEVVADWLRRKTHDDVPLSLLTAAGTRSVREGGRIQTFVSAANFPKLYVVRYTHGDRDTAGRRWTTEVGLRRARADSQLECSVLLQVDDVSPRVDTPVQVSVPRVVRSILEACAPASETPGLAVLVLEDEREVEAFGYEADNPERRYPFIVVSATPEGTYSVDVGLLQTLVAGLAQVVQLPPGADTRQFSRLLRNNHYVAWEGAIRLIYPEVHLRGKCFVPTARLMPEDLVGMRTEGLDPERELLAIITYHTNLPNSWRHISAELVAESERRRELARLKEAAATSTGASAEYYAFLDEYNRVLEKDVADRQAEIDRLQAEMEYLLQTQSETADELRNAQYKIKGLQVSLSHMPTEPASGAPLPDEVRALLSEVCAKNFTPAESLQTVAALYPERVEVLPSAWKAAEQSRTFRERRRAFELLWKLATDYWTALVSGGSDAEARCVFGEAYSAKESETVMGNRVARSLRTFPYQGELVEMMQHLKIGVKPSATETLRIHFCWMPTERKILIGHCGPHLDFK